MVYDANKNQFLRGNFPSAQKRKEQPIKDLNKSADKLTRLIQEIVYNRPIAREAMYDESNPPYIDGRNISNFFRGQREPIDQGSYDSGLMGMMKGGMAKKKKKYGYQEGGAVQDSSMMRQPNPFVPFDQRPPSSGEVMSPIPRGMEQGDYYRSLRNELEMENEELVRDKAQNTLDRIRLDSLLNQVEESKMDSLLNQAPPINEMLRSLPDFPTIENPPRPTKTDFLKELLREGVII